MVDVTLGVIILRILVISDVHGDRANLNKVLLTQSKAEVVIFLGDGADDVEQAKINFPEKMFIMVRGNCDWGCKLPIEEVRTIEGKKIKATHGHMYNVKSTYSDIIYSAFGDNCNIVLFGHTHTAFTDYNDGLYIMNPGSLHGYGGTYGIIDITPNGVVTNILKI